MSQVLAEIVPGLLRLRLPFTFELNHVNVHLVRLEEGWLLVDCGIGAGECFAALEAGLAEAGVAWRDIRALLLTHCHPDHIGLTPKVLELSHARLLMHDVEARYLSQIAGLVEHPELIDGRLREWGVTPAVVESITRAFVGVRKSLRVLEPDERLGGGEILYTAIGPLETVWTPGHSPGHLCLYASRPRLLISGDHVLPTITPNIGWMPDGDPLADFLASLERVNNLDVALVLPSHGDPFPAHRDRIAEIVRHHDERCHNILRGLSQGARTAEDIARLLWGDTLSPFQHRFALFEVMAHLAYLERRERVRRSRSNGVLMWNLLGPVS